MIAEPRYELRGRRGGIIRPDRRGKRLLAVHVGEEVARQIKILAAERFTTTGMLLTQAIELLFNNLGKPLPPSLCEDSPNCPSNCGYDGEHEGG